MLLLLQQQLSGNTTGSATLAAPCILYLTPLQILDDLYPAHGAHKIILAGQIGPANFLAILVQLKNNVCPVGMLELFLNDETVQGNIYLSGLKSGRWES